MGLAFVDMQPDEDWSRAFSVYSEGVLVRNGATLFAAIDGVTAVSRTLDEANGDFFSEPVLSEDDISSAPNVCDVAYTDRTQEPWSEASVNYIADAVTAGIERPVITTLRLRSLR